MAEKKQVAPQENIENYEEFDVVTDVYMPIYDEEEKYSSPILAKMREQNIDPYELLGENKVEGVGPVIREENKEEQSKYSAAFLDFVKDIPEASTLSVLEAVTNLGNNAIQLGGTVSNLLFEGTKADTISQATTGFAQLMNKNSEQVVAKLDQYKKDNDINGVTDLLTDIGLDIGMTIPIQKMLKKTGFPSFWATPLSFGLAFGLSSGDEKDNVIIDSQVINRTMELLNVLPDTPENEVAELVATTFEGTAWGVAGDRLRKVFQFLKNNVPAYLNQQTAVATGGAVAAGEAVSKVSDNIQNNNISQTTEKE